MFRVYFKQRILLSLLYCTILHFLCYQFYCILNELFSFVSLIIELDTAIVVAAFCVFIGFVSSYSLYVADRYGSPLPCHFLFVPLLTYLFACCPLTSPTSPFLLYIVNFFTKRQGGSRNYLVGLHLRMLPFQFLSLPNIFWLSNLLFYYLTVYFFILKDSNLSLQLTVITATTVGYGDFSPQTSAAKVVAMVLFPTLSLSLSLFLSSFFIALINFHSHQHS